MTEQTSYPKISRMAVTSQYFGIFSVASVFLFFLLGIPMALLAALSLSCMCILFAHLSKGGGFRYSGQAMVGLGTSIFTITLCILLIILSLLGLYMAIQMFGLETVLDPDAFQKAMFDFFSRSLESLPTGGNTL